MKRLGIIGTSGFAREVNDVGEALGFQAIYFAKNKAEVQAWKFTSEVVPESSVSKYRDMPFVIGIGECDLRQRIWERLKSELHFATLIHPTASFGVGQRERVEAAIGSVVCAGVRFTNNIQVGIFTIFNLNCTVGHDTIIDNFANLSPGANISGNVHIGAKCWIGTGAVVLQGQPGTKLTIGPAAVIGAGAVVIHDCEADGVYAGVPAKRIR
jgi:sugar O-acyltransferase (sialic acid O-acetyltransferase NeuD family)